MELRAAHTHATEQEFANLSNKFAEYVDGKRNLKNYNELLPEFSGN